MIAAKSLRAAALSVLLLAALSASCGYRLAGRADTLPDTVRTIAVPAFTNATTEFKIEQHLTQAVVREFITRTRYNVVNDENNADALLRGTVVAFHAFPQNFDPATGRATSVTTITRIHVDLWDRVQGKSLYLNPNLEQRETYEVSADPDAFIEERAAALRRAGQSMAETLVSAILEGF